MPRADLGKELMALLQCSRGLRRKFQLGNCLSASCAHPVHSPNRPEVSGAEGSEEVSLLHRNHSRGIAANSGSRTTPAVKFDPLISGLFTGGTRRVCQSATNDIGTTGSHIHSRNCTDSCELDGKASSVSNFNQSKHPFQQSDWKIDARDFHVQGGPDTMKAAVLWEPNGKMEVELLKMPRPKAGELLLKTRACGVCHTDLHVIKAEQAFPMPCVLGHEVTGEVVEIGPNTDPGTLRRVPVGTRVVGAFIMPCGGCFSCTQGNEDLCETFFEYNRGKGGLYDGETRLFQASSGKPISMYSMGGLAEYCVLPATAVTPLPHSLPFAESAIMGCAMFTAYGAIRHGADLRAGQSVAVIGTGGVGSSCIQVARAFGAGIIIAVDVTDAKLDKARSFGATHTINGSSEDVIARIREITSGRGADVSIEALGRASTFNQGVLSVRDGGRAVMVGIAPAGVTAEVDIARLVRRNIKIVGSYGAKARLDLPTLVALAENHQLDVASAVSEHHKLESAGATYRALDRGEVLGRAIVDMNL